MGLRCKSTISRKIIQITLTFGALFCAAPAAAAGLLAVRGAEVVEVRDEEGGLMNDFTGRVRLEDRKPPKGECMRVCVSTCFVFVLLRYCEHIGYSVVQGSFRQAVTHNVC
jgi:hypothetical protein